MIFATLIKLFRQATQSATHIAESKAVVILSHLPKPLFFFTELSLVRLILHSMFILFVLPCVSICFESTISTSSCLRPTCRSVWLCVFPVPKSSKTTIQLWETRDYNCISSYGPWFWFDFQQFVALLDLLVRSPRNMYQWLGRFWNSQEMHVGSGWLKFFFKGAS